MIRRLFVMLILLLAVLGPLPAIGATPIMATASRPWAIDAKALTSTTDWVIFTVPPWCRQILVRNIHASATLYLGDSTETGTFNLCPTDKCTPLYAGEFASLSLVRDDGTTSVFTAHRSIPLASATPSHPVSFQCVETVL
jgi:hypothetical protein